ncbi:Peptidyl-prolyl cis-trans isomerase [Phaffia rhodozyma]|uniref:Peptidyl-prolyl cis-trans isomerase n=1 Tax=Phaffia rhodozyma TaxID=264483 RepID=A0A0F7SJ52_PHARH|nr:Peptidyl-prolyl cis-trans isomerase [Phaffia rhodozyma]
MPSVNLTLYSGDLSAYEAQTRSYEAIKDWVAKSGTSYGLTGNIEQMDEIEKELLEGVLPSELKPSTGPLVLTAPTSLALPTLKIDLSPSQGVQKTVRNFLTFASHPLEFKSKRSPFPLLGYTTEAGSKVFRVEKGFVAQMGDVTRGDGSGGESIYGPTFNDEKEGLKTPFKQGTVAMANSGKNSNSSQFFITLTSSPGQLSKLTGKYVAFGQIDLSDDRHRVCLDRLSELADGLGKGGTTEKVWIGGCEVEN